MNHKEMDKQLGALNTATFNIVLGMESPIDSIILVAVYAKKMIQAICDLEHLPSKLLLERAAAALVTDLSDGDEKLAVKTYEESMYRLLDDVRNEAMRLQKGKKGKTSTVVSQDLFDRIRYNIVDMFKNTIDKDIDPALVGIIVIGAIAQWTGKPVSLGGNEK